VLQPLCRTDVDVVTHASPKRSGEVVKRSRPSRAPPRPRPGARIRGADGDAGRRPGAVPARARSKCSQPRRRPRAQTCLPTRGMTRPT
jgi:hypothetical protein